MAGNEGFLGIGQGESWNDFRAQEVPMMAETALGSPTDYLDMQAYVGITKHNGGMAATMELLKRCHVAEAREVLYVGSGIGVGPCAIVRRFDCRVIAVDISERMLEWSRLRAEEAGVSSRIEFRLGNILDLPLAADRFDAVLVESVLAFVGDKGRAIRECVRVAAPGGYVGMNEAVWLQRPSTRQIRKNAVALGAFMPTADEWLHLWRSSGLQEAFVSLAPIHARTEALSRIRWVGLRWSLGAYGRLLRLLAANPAARRSIRSQLSAPTGALSLMGYALASGRKAAPAALGT